MSETIGLKMPTADQQLEIAIRRFMRDGNNRLLVGDEHWVIPWIKLAPSVTRAHYPALKADILAIPGFQDISVLLDSYDFIPAPAGKRLRLYLEAAVKPEEIPAEP